MVAYSMTGANIMTPRNFVAKNMQSTSRAATHVDRRKELKRGSTKHKQNYSRNWE